MRKQTIAPTSWVETPQKPSSCQIAWGTTTRVAPTRAGDRVELAREHGRHPPEHHVADRAAADRRDDAEDDRADRVEHLHGRVEDAAMLAPHE